MNSRNLTILAVGAFVLSLIGSVSAGEKLKVIILAGQSNMVGHGRGHTMATLYKNGMTKDAGLAKMVFTEDMSKAFEEQLVRARKTDELKKQKGDEATITKLAAECDAYKEKMLKACRTSDRVYITSIADKNKKSGKLSVGYGADDVKIGPEYGFGLSMAQKVEGPILLIKASWGGKSLMYDFRPPSAQDFKETKAYAGMVEKAKASQIKYENDVKTLPEREKKYEADLAAYKEKIKTATDKEKKKLRAPRKPRAPKKPKASNVDNAGHFWREMVKHVNGVLADPKKHHPDYDAGQGYEIAGFVWFQGFNDQFNPEFHSNYADNMKLFIKDVRTTFKTPSMPFVIGVLGTGKTKEKVDANGVSQGQRKAAADPEFKGTVTAVESYTEYSHFSDKVFEKGWSKHVQEWNTVGSDRPYHYLGSGAFFVRLGDSFATAMSEMIK